MKMDVIINRDALYALRELPSESVNCCVTSPPYYGLRDYGLDAQIGREDTPEQYIDRLVEVFRELRRVLKDDGTFWLNIADTYCGSGMKAGCKQKDLIGIPWLLAFALRSDGWYLRSDIIWLKENPMPESCRDRPSRCYEHIFLLTKSKKYYVKFMKPKQSVKGSTDLDEFDFDEYDEDEPEEETDSADTEPEDEEE